VLNIVDDPGAPAAYGGFQFDDEGQRAVAVTLVDHGVVAGRLSDRAGVAAGLAPLAGRGRRPGHVGRVEPMPSHLRLLPGTSALDLDDGFLLEGGVRATVDPSSDRAVIAVQRAREVRGGKRTGRIYADVELVGELATLLTSITEASQATETIGMRDEVDGQPRWRSIEAPWLRGKGLVRARRRAT
jgi:TldD protein